MSRTNDPSKIYVKLKSVLRDYQFLSFDIVDNQLIFKLTFHHLNFYPIRWVERRRHDLERIGLAIESLEHEYLPDYSGEMVRVVVRELEEGE